MFPISVGDTDIFSWELEDGGRQLHLVVHTLLPSYSTAHYSRCCCEGLFVDMIKVPNQPTLIKRELILGWLDLVSWRPFRECLGLFWRRLQNSSWVCNYSPYPRILFPDLLVDKHMPVKFQPAQDLPFLMPTLCTLVLLSQPHNCKPIPCNKSLIHPSGSFLVGIWTYSILLIQWCLIIETWLPFPTIWHFLSVAEQSRTEYM